MKLLFEKLINEIKVTDQDNIATTLFCCVPLSLAPLNDLRCRDSKNVHQEKDRKIPMLDCPKNRYIVKTDDQTFFLQALSSHDLETEKRVSMRKSAHLRNQEVTRSNISTGCF